MSLTERRFPAMGSEIRVLVGPPGGELGSPPSAAERIERELHDFDRRLSRFRPESELCGLNADRREEVPASELLREVVRAGLWAAEHSAGLVDPTLLDELEAAGYQASREVLQRVPLADGLAAAPPRRPATPSAAGAWRTIVVDDEGGLIRRPPGVRFDTGGIGKGLAADLMARRLRSYGRYAIDCGGDVRIGGRLPDAFPLDIEIQHPLTGETVQTLRIRSGAIATSGLDVNVWRRPGGGYAHHLLDPATGEPAWTGLVGATARAATAVEAETLAKAALLGGPEHARALLGRQGGLIVHEDGSVERLGPLQDPERIVVRLPS